MTATEAANRLGLVTRNRVVAAVCAVIIIVLSFLMFLTATQERIMDQNQRYLEGTTLQTSRRVADLLLNAQMMIDVEASSYQSRMTSDQVDPADLPDILRSSPFDHIILVSKGGRVYDDRGVVEGLSADEFFPQGLTGDSGVISIKSSSIDKESMVAFYTPIKYQGDVVGVLMGSYTEVHIAEMLTTYFFGEQTSTYLCDSDGTIIASSVTTQNNYETVADIYRSEELEGITLEELQEALATNTDIGFSYQTPTGMGSAYLMDIENTSWMVLRSFPASLTNGMVSNAAAAAVTLIFGVTAAIILFVAVLLVQSRRQSKQLLFEKTQATRIVDASTNLFQRLVRLDIENGTYEYLKSLGLPGKFKHEGDIGTFREYWIGRAGDEANQAIIAKALDPDLIQRDLTEDTPYLQVEYQIKNADDPDALDWIQISVICLERNSEDTAESVLLAIQDVTEIKRQELAAREALEDAYLAADQASKAKSDFLNSMSHDIRTPMNSIMGLTAIAAMHIDDTERVKDCLNKITISNKHLLGLINEVLDMAKIESGKISLADEEFDIAETVENLLTIVHPQIEAKGQTLKVDIADIKHEHVIGDPMRLQQVFMNIMGNAIKFTPEGGTIGFNITEKPSPTHGSGCYEFTFTDTGCGMDEEFVQRVFEPFSRANDSRTTKVEGTGLGMAIVKSIVSLMNGTVEVESKLNEGSTFRVTVFLKLRDPRDEDLTSLQGLSVLVADDDEDACESAVELLESIGMQAQYVTNGHAAVEAVRDHHGRGNGFAAVILDWKMPEKSGIEAAREIRQMADVNLPIIILSAFDWSSIEQEARETGVDAFISKPLFRSRLIHVMQSLVTGIDGEGYDERKELQQADYRDKRILLTEDNAMAAEIGLDIIGMTGAQVDHAENGQEALDALLQHEPNHYDLVFMDIQMPVMNGYEATRAIRAAAKEGRSDLAELPIVALSADAFAEDIQKAKAAGMNDHMSKPMEIKNLLRMLDQWAI